MHATTEPTTEQLQAAFERMRGPDWPATLHDLMQAVARFGVVSSAAKALARGERVETRGGSTAPARTFERPARREGAHPITPARRRDDLVVDFKSRAAGERDES